MTFQPRVNAELIIDGTTYCLADHPAAPGIPYGQEGRQAVVYQLLAGDERRALKVFKPRYRVPALVLLAERLTPLADLPGLAVCRRTVLTARRHTALLRQYPDLTYAVLMPWIAGPTWMEILFDKRELTPAQSLALARALAEALAGMEERGLAHCDLSGSNLLLPALAASTFGTAHSAIELVDVEQLYSPDFSRPEALPAGSSGYAHLTAAAGLWRSTVDRFAGALLLAEILGWCDPRIRAAAWGESYFDPAESQQPGRRVDLLAAALQQQWGGAVARLFTQAWGSDTLDDCPTFGEWLVALPEEVAAVPQIAPARPQQLASWPAAAPSAPPAPTMIGPRPTPTDIATPRPWPSAPAFAADPRPAAPAAFQDPRARSLNQDRLASLFDAALAAYGAGEWAQSKELLEEVVSQAPGYRRTGKSAAQMLAAIARREAARPRWSIRTWTWSAAGVMLLLALLTFSALWLVQAERNTNAQATAIAAGQATEIAPAQTNVQLATRAAQANAETAIAQSESTTNATITVRVTGQATRTAQAQMNVQASMTAVRQNAAASTVQAQAYTQATLVAAVQGGATLTTVAGLATARATATMVAQEQAGKATSTAVAALQADRATTTAVALNKAQQALSAQTAALQAQQATAQARATSTAQIIARTRSTQTAVARATTQAGATGTAQVMARARMTQTAVARASAQARVAPPTATSIPAVPGFIPVPMPIAPADGAVLNGSSPIVFRAKPVNYPGTIYYRFEIDSANYIWRWTPGRTPVWKVINGQTTVDPGGPPITLQPGQIYHWYVWAFAPATQDDWCGCDDPSSDDSPTWSFSIQP